MVTLRAAGESKAEIYAFGAHVVSWYDAAGRNHIYNSPKALYNGKKAIRGGIPVCFPQFGPRGPLKQHGFARTSTWVIDDNQDAFVPAVTLVLRDSAETRASAWPNQFETKLTVTLAADGDSLSLDLVVKNAQDSPFSFTCALHSYFACTSESVVLSDFAQLKYEDNADEGKPKAQEGDIVMGKKEIDRVYISTTDSISLNEAGLAISKVNFPDAVVWNPYVEKTAALADMPDDDWKKFVCIEPGAIVEPVQLEGGTTWRGSLVLSVDKK